MEPGFRTAERRRYKLGDGGFDHRGADTRSEKALLAHHRDVTVDIGILPQPFFPHRVIRLTKSDDLHVLTRFQRADGCRRMIVPDAEDTDAKFSVFRHDSVLSKWCRRAGAPV